MKNSLLIRWIVILAVVVGWTISIFPMKDRDFLAEFNRRAAKGVAILEQKAERAKAIQAKLDGIADKNSAEYAAALKDLAANNATTGISAEQALAEWKELNRRIENLQNGKDLNGNDVPVDERITYSPYKAVETAARGDNDKNRSIRLVNFVAVPHAGSVNDKTVMRFVRNKTAGKLHLGLDLQGGTEFVVSFDEKNLEAGVSAENVRDQILEILRNRLDKSGVTEPELKGITSTDVSIRMPSVDEGDKVGIRKTIKDAAKLQFFLVSADNAALVQQYNADPNFQNPANVIRKEMIEERNGEEVVETIFLERQPTPVRGDDVKSAFATADEFGRWAISMSFNERGAIAFGDVTGANVGRRLAIVLDDTCYSAPNINGAITGGNAQITGSFTLEEAKRLAGVISSGNLPVSIDISSEFGTEPSLGADSIHSGAYAGIVALLVVLVFMAIYYRFCGIVADIALLVNTVLVFGTMAILRATITMPGIAGMILTVGMAVDANVLIFEHIREELSKGHGVEAAVRGGYSGAFSAIFDSNLTTLLTCWMLYVFGSGTVQGFAVTLAFGVLASMFTALFMTHAIFDLFIAKNWLKSLSMMELSFLKNCNLDFVKLMKPAFILAIVLVVLSLIGFCVRGHNLMGIDFAGGTQISYACDGTEPNVAAVREFLKNRGYDTAKVGYKRGQSGNTELEIVVPALKQAAGETEVDTPAKFSQLLDEKFPECKLTQGSIYQVGPSVGDKFRSDSFKAAIFSFALACLYLAFRFQWMYGVAAVAAVIHDVVVSAGLLFLVFQGQLSLTTVAGFLTIVGYSLNDTIVIFDRVRSEAELHKELTYSQLINKAINSTLSRTMLTTLTTLFAVISLMIFGGGVILEFALVMLFGMICGTFSSLLLSTSIIKRWHKQSVQDKNEVASVHAKKA
ncbi:MAG: protein translocase subunit SecD [Lentisphaeria bacterium]|nr:protein translocase subunit SecD [Lentisphaeria bacterium]